VGQNTNFVRGNWVKGALGESYRKREGKKRGELETPPDIKRTGHFLGEAGFGRRAICRKKTKKQRELKGGSLGFPSIIKRHGQKGFITRVKLGTGKAISIKKVSKAKENDKREKCK